MQNKIRVRFAPSPTGYLHLGNIRTALINYLFKLQKQGTFVLRIEDTDASRNINEAALQIINDLKWLGISYDEGPVIGGPYMPYIQSERTKIYEEHLNDLIKQQKIYPCFCSTEKLEEKRKAQLATGNPPRYDRTCLHLSGDQIKQNLIAKLPFVWRVKINQKQILIINDMARKEVSFDMKNFSDFAITRSNGSFTFLFTNFVDDWLMNITHVIRGEDHLTNSAMQAALFDALAIPLPIFWHLPMLCNTDGKKMSKRDFGFTLNDLKNAGFLPQAICNYLTIIGGSFKKEIQSIEELSQNFDFEHLHTTGAIRYDVDKLLWINHKWISRLSTHELMPYILPFLHAELPETKTVNEERLLPLLEIVKSDCKSLKDIPSVLRFCFEDPTVTSREIVTELGKEKAEIVLSTIKKHAETSHNTELFLETIKKEAKANKLSLKEMFGTVRYLLTGSFRGIGIHNLFKMLRNDQIQKRLTAF